MNFDTFDNDAEETTDAEYFAFVRWLSARTAEELRQVARDVALQKQALCRYYKRGERAYLTPGELIDFLGVNSPSIIDMAGYSEEEGDTLMELSDSLKRAETENTPL